MRRSRVSILIISVLFLLPAAVLAATSSPAMKPLFTKHSVSSADTALLNRYIREANQHLENFRKSSQMSDFKKDEVDALKNSVDTAEQICVDRKLEFPSSLHLIRAEYFMITGDFQSASQEAGIAQKKSKSDDEYFILAQTMNFFGRYNLRTGFYMQAINNFENSIELAEKKKLKGIIPRNYLGLREVYIHLGNGSEITGNMDKMIEYSYKEKDTLNIERGTFLQGTYYIEKDRHFSKADSLLRICLELSLITRDTVNTSFALANLGYNYYLEKKYESAIKSYNRSLEFSTPSKLHGLCANSLGNLGTIYRDLGETGKALSYYAESIKNAKIINDNYNLYWVYLDMSDLHLRQKDTSDAYLSYVQYKKYYDKYYEQENTQGQSDARIRYEADSHNKEVELLSLRLYNQRLLIYGSLGLLVLSGAVLILLLSRAKINAKRRISEMKSKISEITQANLRQQMNPHFIFNTLNSIQYYMYQHDKLATNNYLTKFSSLMRKVLVNSQHTSVPLQDELDALNLYLQLEMIRFKDKFEYEINVDEEIDPLLYKIPTMLIQPYVENSICHGLMPGENKGFVKVDLKLDTRFILCTIEDNGIGREAAMERKKKGENNHNSLGNQIVSSRLDLINALYGTSLKTIYTDLHDENGNSSGTRVEIQIPLLT
jgi:tetratricopeptide (TPR) repeat protein